MTALWAVLLAASPVMLAAIVLRPPGRWAPHAAKTNVNRVEPPTPSRGRFHGSHAAEARELTLTAALRNGSIGRQHYRHELENLARQNRSPVTCPSRAWPDR